MPDDGGQGDRLLPICARNRLPGNRSAKEVSGKGTDVFLRSSAAIWLAAHRRRVLKIGRCKARSAMRHQGLRRLLQSNGAGTTAFQLTNAFAPTAAEVSINGRILTPDGRGLAGATVIVTTQDGGRRSARSNGFGYYGFDGLTAGETIILEVASRRYSFQPQALTLSSNLVDFDLVALP